MNRTGIYVIVVLVILFAACGVFWMPSPRSNIAPVAVAQTTVAQPDGSVDLLITLGIKDTEQVAWEGDITLSQGEVRNVTIVRAARNGTVSGNHFNVRAARAANAAKKNAQKKKKNTEPQLNPAQLRVSLATDANVTVTVKTSRGEFAFAVHDLNPGTAVKFLDGQASVEREQGSICLTGPRTEDDFPVLARDSDGTVWLAYVAYQPSPPLINERVLQGNFELLEPSGHGDQILLRALRDGTWQEALPVTPEGRDVWRPSITIDGHGRIWIAWAEKVSGNWDVYTRHYTPATQTWSETARVSEDAGSDFHAVLATDAQGSAWLAWQGWRGDNYEIFATRAGSDGAWEKPRVISTSPANDWSPAIAADAQGRVFIAWDTYDQGNYDVQLAVLDGNNIERMAVASTPAFEARPHLLCDRSGRLWVAYEEGDAEWGKDYLSADGYRRVGFEKNPGFALYVNRTVRLKCLVNGQWRQPKADLQEALAASLKRNRSLPRLGQDEAGGLWLFVRHHALPGGGGEAWRSYATRFNGTAWEEVRELSRSSNLLDNRPAFVPYRGGLLTVYSGDYRTRTQDRDQDDLFSAVLRSSEAVPEHWELVAAVETQVPPVEVVHPNEVADVAALRRFELEVGDKKLRLLRGEFHRHTEYTAHRDQDGTLEDSWRYALDAGRLDWMGNGDHDNGSGSEYMWWQIQKICDLHHNPPHFVAAMTYERSLQYPNGHRNVMMPRRGIRPLPRGSLESSPETGTVDTKILYAYLKHFGGICASHTSGTNMGTDWRDNDPDVEPVVEIYQGHRHNYEHFGAPRSATPETQIGGYQPAGFVWNALEKGYRLGFQSSSDHVSTHISYAMVFAEAPSREAIIDAFKKRHCYGATDNILLVVRSGPQLMGDVFTTRDRPSLRIQARGTAPIAKLHVVRSNKYIYQAEPGTKEVSHSFTDMDAQPGKTYYYYVRLEQADGNLAWASPMWITYQP